MLKLPKNIMEHPHLELLEAHLTSDAQVLREGGHALATRVIFDEVLVSALQQAFRAGHLRQGLEQIAAFLDKEQKGLQLVQEKTGQTQASRLSRLLIVANDGSERFYRDVDSILHKHASRTWALLLDVSAATLGRVATAKGNPTKAVLIDDKNTLGEFLSALANSYAANRP